MSSRKRIVSTTSGAAGGISPTTGNVEWGPSFGQSAGDDQSTWDAAVATDLTTVALTNTKNVGAAVDLTSVVLDNTKNVGVATDLTDVALDNTKNVGVAVDLSTLALDNEKSAAVAVDLTDVALDNTKSVGVALAGTALGAPFFQGIGTTTQTANSTSVTLTPDTTANDGDFLIVNIASSSLGAETFTGIPSGWTLLRNSAGPPALSTYYKFAGASEPANYTWTGGANSAHCATIIRLTAVDTGSPIDVENAATGTSADPVSPSITTTAANCFMLSVCSQTNALTQTYTPPSGYVERADHAGTNLAVTQVTSETATRVKAATGASGTATHNSNQVAGSEWVCHHIAIAPGELTLAS